MSSFKDAALWIKTLQPESLEDRQRSRLEHAFDRFRGHAAVLADQIHVDLPGLTVHDITHIDALWTTASLIAGYAGPRPIPMNPAEAFVLGGSFLLHDLGNSLAAHAAGGQEILRGKEWRDLVHLMYWRRHQRRATDEEVASPEAEIYRAALMERLRHVHAGRAEVLAVKAFRSRGNPDDLIYLLEDSELRRAYGTFIGRVAASHWWDLSEVAARFSKPVPAALGMPWSVDLLKVACLLRLADAAQIDSSRAPALLMRLRRLDATSSNHWTFQDRILGPDLQDDRLFYRSREPFPREDREAWWLCFDTLRMIDRELRDVDSLLADRKVTWRFAARGVLFADDPARLARESIEVEGWEPVDTRIQISGATEIVERLGGRQLYGDDGIIALRELLANASDAVRARRHLDHPGVGAAADQGLIVARFHEDERGCWLEVEDDGIGMRRAVMTGPLLDFGARYWDTPQALRDHPGLASSGFEPTGRFGIGFYSTFMLGDEVQVVSRHFQAAAADTFVLEFQGLRSRPYLRRADPDVPLETIARGGTRVRVLLRDGRDAFHDALLKAMPGEQFWAPGDEGFEQLFHDYIKYLALTVDVSISAQFGLSPGSTRPVVKANEWLKWNDRELIGRICGSPHMARYYQFGRPSLNIGTDAKPLGRLFPSFLEQRGIYGAVTVGGFRSTGIRTHFEGLLLGVPSEASRRLATPRISLQDLGDWFSLAEKSLGSTSDALYDARLATLMLRLGKRPRHLTLFPPIWDEKQFLKHKWGDEVVIVLSVPPNRYNLLDAGNTIIAPCGLVPFLEPVPGREWLEQILPRVDLSYGGPLAEHALLLLSERWGVDVATLKGCLELPEDWQAVGFTQHSYDASDPEPFFAKVMIVHKPGARRKRKREQPLRIPAPSPDRQSYYDEESWLSPRFQLNPLANDS